VSNGQEQIRRTNTKGKRRLFAHNMPGKCQGKERMCRAEKKEGQVACGNKSEHTTEGIGKRKHWMYSDRNIKAGSKEQSNKNKNKQHGMPEQACTLSNAMQTRNENNRRHLQHTE
jgi:hypothetical protein